MTMGFFNYDLPEVSPLNLVCDAPAEDVNARTLLTDYADRFQKNNIGKSFNMSLLEFLECPKALADELLEMAMAIATREATLLRSIQDDLEK